MSRDRRIIRTVECPACRAILDAHDPPIREREADG